MTLYEIDQAILACIDEESGEIIDADALAELSMERDKKVEGVALWIKNLRAEADALKAEKEAFAEREKSARTKIDSLTAYLAQALNGEKFSTATVAVTFRKSQSVSITDAEAIPEAYMRTKVTTEPDKTAIKDALKGGEQIPGAELVTNLNPQIK